MTTKIGARYRNKVTGLTGTATAKASDPEGIIIGERPNHRAVKIDLTQISLEKEHWAQSMHQNDLWHPDDELEPIDVVE